MTQYNDLLNELDVLLDQLDGSIEALKAIIRNDDYVSCTYLQLRATDGSLMAVPILAAKANVLAAKVTLMSQK